MKLLIVDDQFTSRLKAQRLFAQFAECDSAVNGKEALEAFHLAHSVNRPYDLIIMDILMPEMNGIEALKQIREWEDNSQLFYESQVRVLMVSAMEEYKTISSSFRAGCEGYIIKPITIDKLIKANTSFHLGLDEYFITSGIR